LIVFVFVVFVVCSLCHPSSSHLAFSSAGAIVIMGCRDERRGQVAVDQIKREFPRAHVELMLLDLSRPSSIDTFVSNFTAQYVADAFVFWTSFILLRFLYVMF
jgi:NAD(P)-dependent dehydrogenase (short-subunit alcohol dehydrogenase family)